MIPTLVFMTFLYTTIFSRDKALFEHIYLPINSTEPTFGGPYSIAFSNRNKHRFYSDSKSLNKWMQNWTTQFPTSELIKLKCLRPTEMILLIALFLILVYCLLSSFTYMLNLSSKYTFNIEMLTVVRDESHRIANKPITFLGWTHRLPNSCFSLFY